MPVLLAALTAAVHGPEQVALAQTADRETHRGHVVRDDGVAAGGLVAGGEQCVLGEGVLLRRRQLLLDQAAEDTSFLSRELHAGKRRGQGRKGSRLDRVE